MPPGPTPSNSATTSVLYVRKKDARALKTLLERASLLDKRFRMTSVGTSAGAAAEVDSPAAWICPPRSAAGREEEGAVPVRKSIVVVQDCIAVPVTQERVAFTGRDASHGNEWNNGFFQLGDADGNVGKDIIVGFGEYPCPYSTAMLGNNKRNMASLSRDLNMKSATEADVLCDQVPPLTNVQCALIETLTSWLKDTTKQTEVQALVRKLSNRTCPKKLEVIGDDGTLVIPRCAFFDVAGIIEKGKPVASSEFGDLIDAVVRINAPKSETNIVRRNAFARSIQSKLWETFAAIHNAPRIVRRGDIDPNSSVRESGHRLLHPIPTPSASNHGHIPNETGPKSPGWITVTEHNIHQSFDITRVMFSRGNVTEKKRFGTLVQCGEHVLDMYAGIGYYTLPALIHGGAEHVTACEWNAEALLALRYNLEANGVEGKVAVLEGNCRASLRRLLATPASRDRRFDRISLGLLPSSEGGWALAVACLRPSAGGWLHVHGNVPTPERRAWTHWLCRSLATMAEAAGNAGWIAVCAHVEKVKSFAPKVDHVVADVFVGPLDSPVIDDRSTWCDFDRTGICDDDLSGKIQPTPDEVSPPSCALNADGVLHQSWMKGC